MKSFTKTSILISIILGMYVFANGQASSVNSIDIPENMDTKFLDLNPPQNLIAIIIDNDVHLQWDPPEGYNNWLFWDDQVNYNGISAGGFFYCASRWEPADLAPYEGMFLKKVSFFNCGENVMYEVMVWKGENADTLLVSQNVDSSLVGDWNEIELDTPVLIDATEELWFGYSVLSSGAELSAGADDGPAILYKGDLFSLDGVNWVSLSAEYGLDYNWNLAGFVANSPDGKEIAIPLIKKSISENWSKDNFYPKLESSNISPKSKSLKENNDLLSYNIYQDSVLIGNTTDEEFYIYDLFPGTYEYYVTALYDEGESGPSNFVEIIGCLPVPQNPSATIFNGVNVHLECDTMYYTPEHYNFYRNNVIIGTNVEPEFDDLLLSPGTYEYFITAQFGDEESMYEDILEIEILPPPLPLVLNLIFQGSGFELNWDAWHYGVENAIYNIYYSYDNGPWYLKDTTTDTLYFDNISFVGFHCYNISVENAWPEPVYSNEACDFIMGTEEHIVEKINIYPNPATNVIHISFVEKLYAVSIYNFAGRLVHNNLPGNPEYVINTSEIEPGLYYLKIETKKGLFTEKIIIE